MGDSKLNYQAASLNKIQNEAPGLQYTMYFETPNKPLLIGTGAKFLLVQDLMPTPNFDNTSEVYDGHYVTGLNLELGPTLNIENQIKIALLAGGIFYDTKLTRFDLAGGFYIKPVVFFMPFMANQGKNRWYSRIGVAINYRQNLTKQLLKSKLQIELSYAE